jgi:hypothetical protein
MDRGLETVFCHVLCQSARCQDGQHEGKESEAKPTTERRMSRGEQGLR